MPPTTPHAPKRPGPRPGARVVLLDPNDRVLLLHATDPSDPAQRWWELPGGGLEPGEDTAAAVRRELAEETGIWLNQATIGPCIWIRESRFRYQDRDHHRIDWIHPARLPATATRTIPRPTDNERAGLLGERWWTLDELATAHQERILPPTLASLLPPILAGGYPPTPINLPD